MDLCLPDVDSEGSGNVGTQAVSGASAEAVSGASADDTVLRTPPPPATVVRVYMMDLLLI
jgi:hypothetical protein